MSRGEVTRALVACRGGQPGAVDRLYGLVYDRLRRIARGQLGGSATGVILDTTALVHEAYLKLAAPDEPDWQDRGHFFAVAARAMRQIVVDHVRARQTDKRGGKAERVELRESRVAFPGRPVDLLDLDRALARLELLDARLTRVVELRFFAGLTEPEIASALGVTDRTVRRDWIKARALLLSSLDANREGTP
jgi:RNA polymerase sigma factor (TIGR02999 family)